MSSRRCHFRHTRGLGWRLAAGPGRSRRCRCQTGHSGTRRPGCQYQRRAPPAEGAAFSARAGSNAANSPRRRCSTRTSETRSRERCRRRYRPNGPLRRTRKRPYRVMAGEADRSRGRADGSPGPKAPEHHQRCSRTCSRRARPGRQRRPGRLPRGASLASHLFPHACRERRRQFCTSPYGTGKKTPGGAGTHTGHTGHTGARGHTRAHGSHGRTYNTVINSIFEFRQSVSYFTVPPHTPSLLACLLPTHPPRLLKPWQSSKLFRLRSGGVRRLSVRLRRSKAPLPV